jgi:hypothetical protein
MRVIFIAWLTPMAWFVTPYVQRVLTDQSIITIMYIFCVAYAEKSPVWKALFLNSNYPASMLLKK